MATDSSRLCCAVLWCGAVLPPPRPQAQGPGGSGGHPIPGSGAQAYTLPDADHDDNNGFFLSRPAKRSLSAQLPVRWLTHPPIEPLTLCRSYSSRMPSAITMQSLPNGSVERSVVAARSGVGTVAKDTKKPWKRPVAKDKVCRRRAQRVDTVAKECGSYSVDAYRETRLILGRCPPGASGPGGTLRAPS